MINILYVDDEPALLEITQAYLQRSGDFTVETVDSAVVALERLRTGSYDVIVSDYMMPVMDGIEFLKKVRASGSQIPYILFTGRGREEVVIEAINNGADFYLQKGGDAKAQFTELANKIRYAVGRRRAEESLERTVTNLILSQQVAQVGNWTLDLKKQIFEGSDESPRLFGYPSGYRATMQEIISHIHPEDRAIARDAMNQLLTTGEPYTIDFRIFRADNGEMRYIHSKGQVLQKKNGEPVCVFGVNMDITEQKLVEEELRESEARFRGMADRSSDMILLIDDSMSVSYVSPSSRRIIGYEPEEILHKTDRFAAETIFPSSSFEFKDVIENLRKGLPSDKMEMEIKKKDGTEAHVKMHVIPVIKDGAFAGAQVTVSDITDTKKSELELRKSEKRLRSFIDNLPDLILVHRDGIILYANPAMTESLDIREEELLNKQILDFILPQYHARVAESLRERESSGRMEPYEIEIVSPQGRKYAAIVQGTIFDYEGSPANLVVLTDITDRKKAEEALRNSEKLLGNAMDLAKMANWELDPGTQIFTFNDRFYKLYATTAEREGGYQMPAETYAREFLHPDDRPIVAEEIEKALDKTDPDYISVVEHRIIRRDGQLRHIIVRIGIIKDETGRTVKTYGANQDITPRKVAEDAVREANKKLNILSNITRHDIKNQITAITMLQHLIRKKTTDENLRHYIDMEIEASGQINHLIEFTKEYQDIGVESPRWQKVSDLIASAKDQFAAYPYEIRNDLGPLEIYADPLVLKVFYNLLDNVVRHGKNATQVSFSGVKSGENFILACEDDGGGVDPEMKKDLFQRGHGKNTGYGLYLIREILSITYIKIRETGEPGKGARFEMTVPKGGFRNI